MAKIFSIDYISIVHLMVHRILADIFVWSSQTIIYLQICCWQREGVISDFLKMKQVFMFTFIKVHGHELILKCSLIIIINFISQTWQIKSVYQIWKKSLYLEKYSGLFRYLLPLHCTWRCAYQDRVEPACTGPPVFYTQESPQVASIKEKVSTIIER